MQEAQVTYCSYVKIGTGKKNPGGKDVTSVPCNMLTPFSF